MLSDRRSICPDLSVTLVYCGQMAGQIKMKLGVQVGLGPGDIVLDGDLAPPPQRGTAPQFSAHICWCKMAVWIQMPLGMEVGLGPGHIVYCCQMAGWIKMPLGTKVGHGPGHIVLHGDPVHPPPPKGHSPPQFSADVYCDQTVAISATAEHLDITLNTK